MRPPFCNYAMVNEMRSPGYGEQEGHRQHQGKGARKEDYPKQCGRAGLMALSPAIWLPLLVFRTGQSLSGPWCS